MRIFAISKPQRESNMPLPFVLAAHALPGAQTMSTAQRFRPAHMHAVSRNLLMASGAPRHVADVVSEILVGANLCGHDSHGVLRIPTYLNGIEGGSIVPAAEPEVVQRGGNTMIVDGHNGMGIYTARKAIDLAIDKAAGSGVCCTSFRRIGHFGRLGEYAEVAARAGCIAIITIGVGTVDAVAPYGAARGPLGTNPIAVGVPTGDATPFILDIATSVVAEGKLQVARAEGSSIPGGYILDKHGKSSTDPQDFYDGGYLLPFGAHKGSGLLLLTCLLSGLSGVPEVEEGTLSGAFMQVIRVDAFTPLEPYQRGIRAFLDMIKAIPPAPGFDEVLVPGDFEHRTRVQRLRDGFDVPGPIIEALTDLRGPAERLHVGRQR